jgi:hypothetical protein
MDYEAKWNAAMKAMSEVSDDEQWAKFFAKYCEKLGLTIGE